MYSKDKAFLEKFCVKKSSNLIGLENFGAVDFPITAGLRRYSLHQSKSDQIATHQISSNTIFKFCPLKPHSPLLLLEVGD